jgi:hypothetical protein
MSRCGTGAHARLTAKPIFGGQLDPHTPHFSLIAQPQTLW